MSETTGKTEQDRQNDIAEASRRYWDLRKIFRSAFQETYSTRLIWAAINKEAANAEKELKRRPGLWKLFEEMERCASRNWENAQKVEERALNLCSEAGRRLREAEGRAPYVAPKDDRTAERRFVDAVMGREQGGSK